MATPLVNGRAYDFVQIVPAYLNTPLLSTTNINYSETQEKVNNFGTGNFAVSRGHGPVDASGSMEISMSDAEAMRAAAPNRRLLDIAADDYVLTYGNVGGTPRVHVLKNLEFTTDPGGGAQGDTDLKVQLDFVISHVVRK